MREFRRSARFNRLLKEEIYDIVRNHLRDPRIGFLSIIRVETTEDLRSCKVFVSVLEDGAAEDTLQALERSSRVIRGELLHRLHIRRVPELKFFLDRNIAYSVEISERIDRVRSEEKARETEGEEEE